MQVIEPIQNLPCIIRKDLLVPEWSESINKLSYWALVHVLHVDQHFSLLFVLNHLPSYAPIIVLYDIRVLQLRQHIDLVKSYFRLLRFLGGDMFRHRYFLNNYKFMVFRGKSLIHLAVSTFSKFLAHFNKLKHLAVFSLSDHICFEIDISKRLITILRLLSPPTLSIASSRYVFLSAKLWACMVLIFDDSIDHFIYV
jgi:hypothetical protein